MGNCLSRVDSTGTTTNTGNRPPFGDVSRYGGPRGFPRSEPSGSAPRPSSPSWNTYAEAVQTERDQHGLGKGKQKQKAPYDGAAAIGSKGNSRASLGIELHEMTSSAGVLRSYATLPNPSSTLSPRVLLTSNPSTIAIFDAYPKAKYHFLVLPRFPFPPQSNPDSTRSIVQLHHLDDLRSLLLKPSREAREQIVNALADTAREVEEMIRDEMVKEEGVEWKIDVGFHAIPSLKHVHLHVISEDRISPALKSKKHYNSFRPDLGFFISIMDVQRWIQNEDDAVLRERVDALLGSSSLLASPLTCFKCDEPYHTIPKLKAHLEKEFVDEKKKGLERIRRTGKQRSSDEDMF